MTQASELALHDKHLCKKLVLFFQRSNTLKKTKSYLNNFFINKLYGNRCDKSIKFQSI